VIFDNQDFVHGSRPACFKVMENAETAINYAAAGRRLSSCSAMR
jgi:hypothetical protein